MPNDSNPLESNTLIGSELDKRYRILSPLGKGGMGAVFLGEHMRIGRQVAIKVLNSELASSADFLERFEREAIAAGRLDHPNCVPVTDSGHLDNGTAYLVMEYVDGESLGAMLKKAGSWVEPVRALRIIRHVLRGLGHAHDMGIVHRDVKPDNIMLCVREDDRDFARVLDFGIAKLRDDDSKEKEALTQAGVAVGTPAYLSPEQALGDTIDPRSDLYSCSVVLFELLTGRPPFEASNPIGILTKHATVEPPALWDIAPRLEEAPFLNELVQRGLSKEREHRYQTASEFVTAIDFSLRQLGAQLTPVPDVRARSQGFTGEVPFEPRAPSTADHYRAATAPTVAQAREAGVEPHTTTLPYEATALHPRLSTGRIFLRRLAVITSAGTIVTVAILLSSSRSGNVAPSSSPTTEVLLQRHQAQLRDGETCKLRLKAVLALETLGDERAVPALRKARRRMRGGVIGVGKKNTNRCLTKAANQAITALTKE